MPTTLIVAFIILPTLLNASKQLARDDAPAPVPAAVVPVDPANVTPTDRETAIAHAMAAPGEGDLRAVDLLANTLHDNPADAEAWVALLHTFPHRDGGGDGGGGADRLARAALRLNPYNPRIRLVRALNAEPALALDVLAELGKTPEHHEEAERLSEIISLGVRTTLEQEPVPLLWDDRSLYVAWADRLICAGRLDRAMAVLDEGLVKWRKSRPLMARKAMVLALRDQFDEAMRLQKSAGFVQANIEGKYKGLGDVMLLKGRPELSIASFGDVSRREPAPPAAAGAATRPGKDDDDDDPNRPFDPDAAPREDHRDKAEHLRVLAIAYAQTGQLDHAKRLLPPVDSDGGSDDSNTLLIVRAYIHAGKMDEAKAFVDAYVAPLQPGRSAGILSDWRQFPRWDAAVSLELEYEAAMHWMIELHPDKKVALEDTIGPVDERRQGPTEVEIEPVSRALPALRERLRIAEAAGDEGAIFEARLALGSQLQSACAFAAAAEVLAPLARRPAEEYWRTHQGVTQESVTWSGMRRAADAERLFAKEPLRAVEAEVAAFKLANALVMLSGNTPDDADSAAARDAAVATLVQLGPGALAVAGWPPAGRSPGAYRPYLDILERVGGPQDAPPVIAALGQMMGEREAPDAEREKALIASLEKLTGVHGEGATAAERLAFWASWWARNADKIVADATPHEAVGR